MGYYYNGVFSRARNTKCPESSAGAAGEPPQPPPPSLLLHRMTHYSSILCTLLARARSATPDLFRRLGCFMAASYICSAAFKKNLAIIYFCFRYFRSFDFAYFYYPLVCARAPVSFTRVNITRWRGRPIIIKKKFACAALLYLSGNV